jgi:hypothetical protein
MKTLVVFDVVTESRDESGALLTSEQQLVRIVSGLPVIRESYRYEMNRYRFRSMRACLQQFEADVASFMKPIGQVDFLWV